MRYTNLISNLAKIALIALLCLTTQSSYAVKAYPGVVETIQPDGTKLKIRIHGDEIFNYVTTDDGYTIAKGKDGYFYFASHDISGLSLSSVRADASTLGRTAFTRGVTQNVIDYYRNKAILNKKIALTRSISKPGKPQKVLVIMAQFSDVKFSSANTAAEFNNYFNQEGYNHNGASGSVRDYYRINSMGAYNPEFIIAATVTTERDRAYYMNSVNGTSLFAKDVCNLAKAQGVNFANYDSEQTVFILFAGHNGAERGSGFWPQNNDLPQPLELDGKTLSSFLVVSELKGASGTTRAGIGTACHEFGHVLGMVDIYDTSQSSNKSPAFWGSFSLMDGGNYNNEGNTPPYLIALERMVLGWLEPKKIPASGSFTLKSIDQNEAYIIETKNPGEYFLLENRQLKGWDAHIGYSNDHPKGMLISHIDRSQNMVGPLTAAERWFYNAMNSNTEHQCIDMVEASGSEKNNELVSDFLFPGTMNVVDFDDNTIPNNRPWSGTKLGTDLYNIKLANEVISFDAVVKNIDNSKAYASGYIKNILDLPLKGVKVNLYKQDAGKAIQSGSYIIWNAPETKAGTPDYTYTTDARGFFEFVNLAPGAYKAEISINNYETQEVSWTFKAGNNSFETRLMPVSNSVDYMVMKWHNNTPSRFVGNIATGAPIYGMVKFITGDLARYQLDGIKAVSVAVNGAAKGALTLKSGTKVIYTANATTTSAGNMVFNFERNFIKKDNTKDLIVEIALSDYDKSLGILGLDSSVPTQEGKGNNVSSDGTTWTSMDAAGPAFRGNFMISVMLGKNRTSAYYTLITDKASYSANEPITMFVHNLKGNEKGIRYKMGTTENSTGSFTATAGEHTIQAVITLNSGAKETITKIINVQ